MHVKSKEYMPLAKQNATLKKRNMNALFFREKEKKKHSLFLRGGRERGCK